ncbi:hypothetical protein HSX11_19965 [Oxalobacteraceae bacterium]|nr:hypothetical protein [Oxalobacteraceae bacterium]
MSLQADEEIVKTGTFLYDALVTCDVRIVRSPICYGSGDHEDPPEIADDHARETFYIQYGSTTERGRYTSGGRGYPTLSDAVDVVEGAPGFGSSVQWRD